MWGDFLITFIDRKTGIGFHTFDASRYDVKYIEKLEEEYKRIAKICNKTGNFSIFYNDDIITKNMLEDVLKDLDYKKIKKIRFTITSDEEWTNEDFNKIFTKQVEKRAAKKRKREDEEEKKAKKKKKVK